MPVISGLTYTKTDSTIVAVWTTDVSSDSNLFAGAKAAIDNGVAAAGTSHQAIVTGLLPSTTYACHVVSGGTSSATSNVTTNALQTRVLVTSAKNSAYTLGNHTNNDSDTQRTFLSSDNVVYVTMDDGHGIIASTTGASAATTVAAITNETNMTGNAGLLTTYGASASTNGTDGPAGGAMTNKSTGLFGLNANLHMFVYRQFPPTYTTNRYCNWIKSTNHGSTWNNFTATSTFVSGGNPVTPNSPAEPVQFYALTIGLVVPVLYAADDGTLGYNTAGNQIDGANGFVYMNYTKDADNTTLYMMRIPRIQFDAQNAAAIQYWAGTVPYPSPLDFVNDANWSNSQTAAVNMRPPQSAGGTQFFNTGLWNQIAFIPTINSYINTFSASYDGSGRTLWQSFAGPTPVGPWSLFYTQVFSTSGSNFNGFFPFHRDIAGNSVSTNITAKFLQSVDETIGNTHYALNYSTLTMLPSSGAAMTQQYFYGFTTVENPLSNNSNFATITSQSALQVTGTGVCEATGLTSCGAYLSSAVPGGDTGGTWPADHYVELQITSSATSDLTIPRLRQSAGANTCYQLVVSATTGSPTALGAQWYYVVAGSATTIGTTFNITVAAGDVIRASVTGQGASTTLVTSQNGVQLDSRTDAGGHVAGPGSPAFTLVPSAAIANLKMATFAAGANQASAPTFSPIGGSYTGTQTVTITGPASSTIYYTTNGTTPTRSSLSIATGGTISVTSTSTIKAIASVSNFVDSQVSGATYNLSGTVKTTHQQLRNWREGRR